MGLMVRDKRFPSANGIFDIHYRIWQPDEVRGAVQIMHGMAEHIERYDSFAKFLASNGILVFGMDASGHGKSVRRDEPLGYFGEKDGWDHLIADNKTLHDTVLKEYPSVPCILFGHSMGSFLARSYAGRMGYDYEGFVFSGTSGKNWALPFGKCIAKAAIKRGEGKKPNKKLDSLSFGSYNKRFCPARTPFDWLSRDTAEVDRYVEDPLCGFVFTSYGFYDLFTGMKEISDFNWAKRVPNRPVFLLSGEQDPVGNFGKGVRQVDHWLARSGHRTCVKLYPQGRHEMLNETNREEVYHDVLLFTETVIASGEVE